MAHCKNKTQSYQSKFLQLAEHQARQGTEEEISIFHWSFMFKKNGPLPEVAAEVVVLEGLQVRLALLLHLRVAVDPVADVILLGKMRIKNIFCACLVVEGKAFSI